MELALISGAQSVDMIGLSGVAGSMLETHPQHKLSGVVQGPTMNIKHTPIYLGDSKGLKVASQDWRQRPAIFFSTWK